MFCCLVLFITGIRCFIMKTSVSNDRHKGPNLKLICYCEKGAIDVCITVCCILVHSAFVADSVDPDFCCDCRFYLNSVCK